MREHVLDVLESVTGLRMNHAFIRPGSWLSGHPEDAPQQIHRPPGAAQSAPTPQTCWSNSSIWMSRTEGVGYLEP